MFFNLGIGGERVDPQTEALEVHYHAGSAGLSSEVKINSEGDERFAYEMICLFADKLDESCLLVKKRITADHRTYFRSVLHQCRTTLDVVDDGHWHQRINWFKKLDENDLPAATPRVMNLYDELSRCVNHLTAILRTS